MKKFWWGIIFLCIMFCGCSLQQTEKPSKVNSDFIQNNLKGWWMLYSVNDTIVTERNCAEWPNGFVVYDLYSQDFYRWGFNPVNTIRVLEYKDEWKIFNNSLYFGGGFSSISKWMAANIFSDKMEQEHISILVSYSDIQVELIDITSDFITFKYKFRGSINNKNMEYTAKFKKFDSTNFIIY